MNSGFPAYEKKMDWKGFYVKVIQKRKATEVRDEDDKKFHSIWRYMYKKVFETFHIFLLCDFFFPHSALPENSCPNRNSYRWMDGIAFYITAIEECN